MLHLELIDGGAGLGGSFHEPEPIVGGGGGPVVDAHGELYRTDSTNYTISGLEGPVLTSSPLSH